MGSIINAISGLVGVVVASVLAYVFWKREWAIQREASERQERRRVQLDLAEKVLQIATALIHEAGIQDSKNSAPRRRLEAELKAMSGPVSKFFSEKVTEAFRRFEFEQREVADASQMLTFVDRAHRLIDALYAETFSS
jgi:hypothetical protein